MSFLYKGDYGSGDCWLHSFNYEFPADFLSYPDDAKILVWLNVFHYIEMKMQSNLDTISKYYKCNLSVPGQWDFFEGGAVINVDDPKRYYGFSFLILNDSNVVKYNVDIQNNINLSNYDIANGIILARGQSIPHKVSTYIPSYEIGSPSEEDEKNKTSWYKAHLLDQKQNKIIQGKYLEFTNKADSTDISKVAIVGGGILASGFKGATSTVDSFRVLTNAKLKPGTYKEGLEAALGIKNSIPTYNMFNNVNGYKYVGMFKVIPDAVKVEELKNVGDTATGTIASAGGYVLATGKKALMEALGFFFNSQAGLWMMRTSAFMTLSTSTGEIAVNGTEGQILYERTSTTDVTGMNDPALDKQSDYWDAVSDYYNKQKQDEVDNGTVTEGDETPTEETTENPINDVMENIKTLWEKISGLVENAYTNISTKNDILNVEHEEATQLYDNSLSRPEAKQQAFELEYSKQIEEDYTDTAGNTQSILKGSKANTKINTRKNIEQHVKDYSDNESYAELNNFNPSEYLHEEQEIVPNSTYEEVEYKIMALAMELISGTITKADYETRLNELR